MQNGSTVRDAVEDIIARGVGELRKIAFGDDVEDTKNLPWKQEQAWAVLKRLAKDDEVSSEVKPGCYCDTEAILLAC